MATGEMDHLRDGDLSLAIRERSEQSRRLPRVADQSPLWIVGAACPIPLAMFAWRRSRRRFTCWILRARPNQIGWRPRCNLRRPVRLLEGHAVWTASLHCGQIGFL